MKTQTNVSKEETKNKSVLTELDYLKKRIIRLEQKNRMLASLILQTVEATQTLLKGE